MYRNSSQDQREIRKAGAESCGARLEKSLASNLRENKIGELRAVPFGEKAILALLSLSKESRIFRRFAKCCQHRISLQIIVGTESAFDRGFDQTRRERISHTRVEQLCLSESGSGSR